MIYVVTVSAISSECTARSKLCRMPLTGVHFIFYEGNQNPLHMYVFTYFQIWGRCYTPWYDTRVPVSGGAYRMPTQVTKLRGVYLVLGDVSMFLFITQNLTCCIELYSPLRMKCPYGSLGACGYVCVLDHEPFGHTPRFDVLLCLCFYSQHFCLYCSAQGCVGGDHEFHTAMSGAVWTTLSPGTPLVGRASKHVAMYEIGSLPTPEHSCDVLASSVPHRSSSVSRCALGSPPADAPCVLVKE